MLQEDSNGEGTFEIIDKKLEESSNNDSMSSISSPYSIPSPSVMNLPGGNLLSNLPPPSNLPDFTILPSQPVTTVAAPSPLPPHLLPPSFTTPSISPVTSSVNEVKPALPSAIEVPPLSQPFIQTQFSPAIPPNKGIQHGPVPPTVPASSQDGGLLGWMKEAVTSGGILSKVAEKAKHSVDSLITTLDPQMSEFIYSGGDVEVVIASQDLEEISPIRDAIYAVFGKAWVNGVNVKTTEYTSIAVGFDEGVRRAEEKIDASLQFHNAPVIAIQNILLQHNTRWFHLSVLLLKDSTRKITVQTFTQTIPIPADLISQAEKDMPELVKSSVSTEQFLAVYLKAHKNAFQPIDIGVSRKDVLLSAAKVLLGQYKRQYTTT